MIENVIIFAWNITIAYDLYTSVTVLPMFQICIWLQCMNDISTQVKIEYSSQAHVGTFAYVGFKGKERQVHARAFCGNYFE